MYTIHCVVEGTGRGLLMHKFSVEASAGIETKVKKATKDYGSKEDEAEEVAYRLDKVNGQPKGQLCLPAEHFLGAITNAGSGLRIQGQGKKTYKGAFQGQLDVIPDYLGLTDSKGAALFNYAEPVGKIDSRPVRIKATSGRIVRHRPHIFAGWRTEFDIQVGDSGIPLEVVQAAVEAAGQAKCVGDYRPRYGQFRIVSFDKVAGVIYEGGPDEGEDDEPAEAEHQQ